jgi:predicted RNA-binding Zn-ribbon protein involved in translation (DUF1610 family)
MKADVAGHMGKAFSRMGQEMTAPMTIIINTAREVQRARSSNKRDVGTRFKCASCGKTSVICPACDRALILPQKRHLAEYECPHCYADLYNG